jgi:uncharacterized damage-inducible protein DinB
MGLLEKETYLNKRYLPLFLAGALVVIGSGTRAFAQTDSPMNKSVPAADKTPPSYDMKPQSLLDLEDMQKKFVTLAQAIPAEKYTWRPSEGVRSISEVFLHVAGLGFQMAPVLGATREPGFKMDSFEKSTTQKTEVIAQLDRSFHYVQAAIEKMTNADFQNPEKQFGPQANAGDIVYLIVVDDHEHLGQSVAYARVNGIVPPWTAEKMKHKQPEK